MITLWQAEWCPFSSAVRELLTELGIPFVARPVEPWPEQRDELRRRAGTDQIPVLETEDGQFVPGTRAIFRHLETLEPWRHAPEHRQRFLDHMRPGDTNVELVERAELRAPAEAPADDVALEVEDEPGRGRYVLRAGDRELGSAAYRLSGDTIVFTHTEVGEGLEGRGLGRRLVEEALADADRRGLDIVPLCPFVRHVIRSRVRP